MLDISTLENWLWEAACAIRGPVDAPKFKDYILPLIFLKRLSDVFDDEIERLSAEFGSRDRVLRLLEQERESGQVRLVRFYLPEDARWHAIRRHGVSGLGQFLTDAVRLIARENPSLRGRDQHGGFQCHRRRSAHHS
jgi:type I restriction enzyme M protein